MNEIKFGTDGFRGIIADNFTFKNIEKVSQAYADYLVEEKKLKGLKAVIVGYDRRFLSERFARTVAEVLSKNGIPVFLVDNPVPTPAVSFFIRKKQLAGGIIITASHNPPYFNGLKIKNEQGSSAEQKVTEKIEKLIVEQKNIPRQFGLQTKIRQIKIIQPYVNFLKKYLNFEVLKNSHFKIIIDVMHGVGNGIFEKVLKNTKCQIITINGQRDPLFGGVSPEPISQNLGTFIQKLKKANIDLGIALDGDADRIAALTAKGQYVSSHQIICLLLLHFIENRHWSGRIVKTINTTTLVDKIAGHYKLPLKEVPVGFKNIAKEMISGDVLLGGEESGGIGFKNYMPERDGILSGLLLLELMAYRKRPFIEIIRDMQKRFGKFVYLREDLARKDMKKQVSIPPFEHILGRKVVQIKTYDGTKFILEDESWLLIRASGTEPIIRIYAESHSLKKTQELVKFGCRLIWKKN